MPAATKKAPEGVVLLGPLVGAPPKRWRASLPLDAPAFMLDQGLADELAHPAYDFCSGTVAPGADGRIEFFSALPGDGSRPRKSSTPIRRPPAWPALVPLADVAVPGARVFVSRNGTHFEQAVVAHTPDAATVVPLGAGSEQRAAYAVLATSTRAGRLLVPEPPPFSKITDAGWAWRAPAPNSQRPVLEAGGLLSVGRIVDGFKALADYLPGPGDDVLLIDAPGGWLRGRLR